MKKTFNRQSGATFLEYAIALGTLLVVFVAIGILLEIVAVRVARRSVESIRHDVPCRRDDIDKLLPYFQCY